MDWDAGMLRGAARGGRKAQAVGAESGGQPLVVELIGQRLVEHELWDWFGVAVKRAFNLAHESELVSRPPKVPSIRVNNTREGCFEAEELKALIDEMPEPLKPVVRFAVTGWRRSEVWASPGTAWTGKPRK